MAEAREDKPFYSAYVDCLQADVDMKYSAKNLWWAAQASSNFSYFREFYKWCNFRSLDNGHLVIKNYPDQTED